VARVTFIRPRILYAKVRKCSCQAAPYPSRDQRPVCTLLTRQPKVKHQVPEPIIVANFCKNVQHSKTKGMLIPEKPGRDSAVLVKVGSE